MGEYEYAVAIEETITGDGWGTREDAEHNLLSWQRISQEKDLWDPALFHLVRRRKVGPAEVVKES